MPKILWHLISASQRGFQIISLPREISLVNILCILEVCIFKRVRFFRFSLSSEGSCDSVDSSLQMRDDCLMASTKWWVGKAVMASQTSDAMSCFRACCPKKLEMMTSIESF